MQVQQSISTVDNPTGRGEQRSMGLGLGILCLLWQLVRLPIFTFLVILEPVVRMFLAGLALLGILMAFFFKFSGAAPHFSFWSTLAISVGFGLLLLIYEAMVRLFSR